MMLSRLLCVAILLLPVGVVGETAKKKGAVAKDDLEIVENLEMFEMLEMLEKMELLADYEAAQGGDRRGGRETEQDVNKRSRKEGAQ